MNKEKLFFKKWVRSEEKGRAEALRASLQRLLRDYAEAFLISIGLAFLLRIFVVGTYQITSTSMAPTLMVGDFILGFKTSYGLKVPFSSKHLLFRNPHRGDVVVFACPRNLDELCIKRLIGLPGDRIEIKKGRLWVNGQRAHYEKAFLDRKPPHGVILKESFPSVNRSWTIWVEGDIPDFGPIIVPPKRFFVLGDRRGKSVDSRVWGTLPMETLEGKAVFIWFSLDWTNRVMKGSLWPEVRWKRFFQPVSPRTFD